MDDATTSAPRTSTPTAGQGSDAPPVDPAADRASTAWDSVANPRRTTL